MSDPLRDKTGRTGALMALGVIGAAFVLAFALDRATAAVLGEVVERSEIRFSTLYRGDVDADVVCIGNSRAVNACPANVMSEALDARVFNLAYNGMSSEISLALFADYLDHNRAPELLLIEATGLTDTAWLVPELRVYAGHSERIAALVDEHRPSLATASEVAHTFRFNNELFLRNLYYFGPLGRDDQSWVMNRRISEEQLEAVADQEVVELEVREENARALAELVALARAHDVEVVVFVAPWLPQYQALQLNAYRDWLARARAALPNDVVVLDYAEALGEPKYFADRLHLNRDGAAALLRTMREDDVFAPLSAPDERVEPF